MPTDDYLGGTGTTGQMLADGATTGSINTNGALLATDDSGFGANAQIIYPAEASEAYHPDPSPLSSSSIESYTPSTVTNLADYADNAGTTGHVLVNGSTTGTIEVNG